jgi:hypothetical protein
VETGSGRIEHRDVDAFLVHVRQTNGGVETTCLGLEYSGAFLREVGTVAQLLEAGGHAVVQPREVLRHQFGVQIELFGDVSVAVDDPSVEPLALRHCRLLSSDPPPGHHTDRAERASGPFSRYGLNGPGGRR